MRSRPVRNPIFLGLGTAAILAAGGATTAALAAPSPSPSGTEGSTPSATDSPSPTPPITSNPQNPQPEPSEPKAKLSVEWVQSTGTVHGGTVVKGTVLVKATNAAATATRLVARATGGATVGPTCARGTAGCDLGTVSPSKDYGGLTVTIPKSMTKGTVSLTVTAWAGNSEESAKDVESISVTRRPTANTNNRDSDSGDSGDSGSNSNPSSNGSSGGGAGTNGNTSSIPGSGTAFVPPGAGGLAPATNGVPSAQFPQIAPQSGQLGADSPVVAGGGAQNMGALRAASPEPQELTFQRLASTQAAWLAALLVAFSLLLTHIRLNKPADARRRKGVHRRQRTGVFQA